ncbi:MAG: CHAT domain-containing protein, partial [Bacteroidota bacterium]
QPPSIAKVQEELINKEEAIIAYFIGQEKAYAFVITQKTADLVVLPVPNDIQRATIGYQKALLDIEGFQTNTKATFGKYNQTANQLYQKILAPILSSLPPSVDQLLIIPDGELTAIPFSALTTTSIEQEDVDFGKLPYLLYNYQIHYAYSASLQLKNQERRTQIPANVRCLAMAPPYEGEDINQRGRLVQLRSTGQLEGTAQEIQAIANHIQGQFDFSYTATEGQFKALAPQFGILHLAMHGVADLEDPNFNHLKFTDLASAADSTEDNLLYHYEIANLDLAAQLVVLSACETGVGKYEEGEGVYSLARSFSYAGVPSIVMSLWRVNDLSTSELMPLFYQNLAAGETKDAAIHKAKIDFLQSSNLEYRHPFYWAAFVGIGDTSSINQSIVNWQLFGIGAALALFIGWLWWRRRS